MLNAHHKKMSIGKRTLLFWHLVCIYISWSEANLGVAVSDPCSSNPCWNAGTCVTNGSVFTCNCPQGFSGQKCEFHVTHCAVNQCVNGICRLSQDGLPQCFCTPGFIGEFCHINVDECASQPCKNGALCVDEVNGYKCVCQGDTYGRHCEIHERDIMQCVARCEEEPCWRNQSVMIPVKWGYGDSICSTSHSCFGGENDTEADLYDTFVEVQLKPLQIQLGDTLNFTADEEIVAYVDGFVPHHVVAANGSSAFRACNESNGIPLVNKPTNSVVVGLDILTLGTKYFIANIDSTFRCNFGLRLNVSVKESNCKAPSESEICSGRGQCSTNFSLPDFRCKCCGGFRGEFCEKVDYCFSKPCKNNAVCQNRESSADGSTHVCICEPGYEGRDCSEIKDLCLSSPCLNGGSCISGVNNFTCHCARGFSGRNCEVDINECASGPCVNGGSCVDDVGSFSCHCPAGFTGSHCEVDVDECLPSPCVHGTCIDQVNSFNCHCSPGYAGIKCDYNLKECLSNPCHNGGSCVDEVNGFRCDCGPGYTGDYCQTDVDLCKEPMMCVNSLSCIDKGQSVECSCKAGFTGYNCAVNINDCLSHPCKNGGTCRDEVDNFECICPDGFTGKACEVVEQVTTTATARKPSTESTETTPAPQFNRQFTLKLITENCNLLKGSLAGTHILQGIASSMAESCSCNFGTGHIVAASVLLLCRDRINAEMSMELKPVNEHSVDNLICQFSESLNIQHKNVIDVGYNTYAVRVLSNVSTCSHQNDKGNGGASKGGNIAVTIASVCAAVGLIVAAVIVCLKCRRVPPLVKKRPSKGENEVIEDLSADLLSAVAPTPKSMYRTSGGYHNMAFSGRFNPENPVKSRRV